MALRTLEREISAVEGLLPGRSPPAIAGHVAEHVVPAVNSEPRRTGSHVAIEVHEALEPAFTDSDSPSAVAFPLCMARIRATPDHGTPAIVFTRMGKAMLSQSLSAKAATAFRIIALQGIPIDCGYCSAIAPATAFGYSASRSRNEETFEHYQAPKSPSLLNASHFSFACPFASQTIAASRIAISQLKAGYNYLLAAITTALAPHVKVGSTGSKSYKTLENNQSRETRTGFNINRLGHVTDVLGNALWLFPSHGAIN